MYMYVYICMYVCAVYNYLFIEIFYEYIFIIPRTRITSFSDIIYMYMSFNVCVIKHEALA